VRVNPRRPENGLPTGLKPLKASPKPPTSWRTAAQPLLEAASAHRTVARERMGSDSCFKQPSTTKPRGAGGVERRPGSRKGNPLKGEPQERRRYETRPAGFRGEESVKRLRKPEDAAQPGEANPVHVAPRYLIRCRGEKPQERGSARTRRLAQRRTADGPARVKLWSRAKSRRGIGVILSVHVDLGLVEKPRRPTPRGAKVKEGSSTHTAIPRTLARL